MVWQSLLSSLFPTTNQGFTKFHDENRNSDRPLVDHQGDIKINQTRTSTYGSGSLDATATTATMKNESSVLVEHGDSESDGIHKVNAGESSDIVDSDIDGYCYKSCTWKEYFSSWRFVELVLCVVPFSVLWMYFESNTLLPRMRPMPFQTIVTTNDDDQASTTISNAYNAGEWDSLYTNNVWNPVNMEKSVGDTIGHKEYQILFGIVPWLLQLAMVWCLEARKGRTGDFLHRTTCMYFVGIGATDFITNCVKYYVGYLRPVFLDICQPLYDENDSTFRCSNQHWNATDARMSFPSNHSGWSFCGMMLLSLYLEQNFGLSSCPRRKWFRSSSKSNQGGKREDFVRRRNILALYRMASMLCYAPILFAVFCAASRVVDNRHFPADVIGGAVLGGSVASLVFGIWFPKQQQEAGSYY